MKIIDNFLEDNLFQEIQKDLQSENMPWFFKTEDVPGNRLNKNGFFNHCYYVNSKINSVLFEKHITPFLNKLNIRKIIEVRANLTFRDKESIQSGYHIDNENIKSKTAIYFFTKCNSKTVLRLDNELRQIESVPNRILVFNTPIYHKVIYPTDVHKRFVFNFNYETY